MDTKAIQSSTKFLKEEKGTFQGGYRGIPIFAGENLHEVCFETIMSLDLRKDIEILVLGAGAGAFDQRLIDHGYHNITAVEFVKENYQAENTRVFDYDLNEEFQNKFEGKKFDLVIAIEIIEHLYSPYDFLRKIKVLLTSGGHLLLSTPNPENGISRIKFLLARQLQLFGPLDLKHIGHISPIFRHVLQYYVDSLGFTILKETTNKSIFSVVSFKLKCIYILFYPLFLCKRDEGQISVYLLQSIAK